MAVPEATPPSTALEQLLAEYVERRERGESIDPDSFAAEQPADVSRELVEALRALEATEELFPGSFDDLPARLGPFRVLGEIGRGGMGRVLRVRRDGDPQAIALKVLHVGLQGSTRALERFDREGAALRRIRHPGIVRVLETGLAGRSPFIAMELVEGTSLATLLQRAREAASAGGPNPCPSEHLDLPGAGDGFDRAARTVARIARAVAAAHREGVLHRDIKPNNILVRPDGEPVLIDFGLVRAEHLSTLTATGDRVGTPPYMAPEQARGERIDERTDVYALGAVLYELLTLQPPRSTEDTISALRQAGSLPVPTPRRRVRSIPRELALVVRRATAFARRWRYAQAEELAADLESFLEGGPILARPPGALERGLDLWLTRKRAIVACAAALVVVAFAVLLWPATDRAALELRAASLRNDALVHWLEGELQLAREDAVAAAEILPDAWDNPFLLALSEDRLPESSSDAAMAGFLDAERKRRAGNPEGALRQFEATLNIAPTTPMVLFFLGLAAREAGRHERAEWAFELVARQLFASPTLHRWLGEAYAAQGKAEDAVKAFDTALLLAPDDPGVLRRIVVPRYLVGEGASALEAAERALALSSDPALRAELRAVAEDLRAEGRDDEAQALADALGRDTATGGGR